MKQQPYHDTQHVKLLNANRKSSLSKSVIIMIPTFMRMTELRRPMKSQTKMKQVKKKRRRRRIPKKSRQRQSRPSNAEP